MLIVCFQASKIQIFVYFSLSTSECTWIWTSATTTVVMLTQYWGKCFLNAQNSVDMGSKSAL
jgi:hypothetical protein